MSRLDELTMRLADNEITPAELEELLALLADPHACRQFQQLMSLEGALRTVPPSVEQKVIEQLAEDRSERVASGVMSALQDGPAIEQPRRFRHVVWYSGAVALLILVALFAWNLNRSPRDSIAQLERISGEVTIVANGKSPRTTEEDSALRSGDTIEVRGSSSSAVVKFNDGTELWLVGDTRITCRDEGSKQVQLHAGSLSASVRPQPAGRPLLVNTSDVKVSVLGTRFSLSSAAERTDIRVVEGNVRLTRISDGASVEVAGGERAVAAPREDLVVEPTAKLADTWEANFEQDLPQGWQCGVHETTGLPQQSRGAVRASHSKDGTDFKIVTQNGWTDGLFEIDPQNYLNYRIKFDRPGFYHVLLGLRDAEAESACNYEYQEPNRPNEPGKWRTVSLPLADFKRIPAGTPDRRPFEQRTGGPPEANDVAYFLLFSTQRKDRGMVIDRIWISRGPPAQQ